MRISDDRYDRDRARLDLAIRMMYHGARTSIIRTWTGLSTNRIRKLYNSYLAHRADSGLARHRGKSPYLATSFLSSSPVNFEATTLSCLFRVFGVLARAPGDAFTLQQGELFCLAYETYANLHVHRRLSFEHAWLLLLTLLKGQDLKLSHCPPCGRLYLTDAVRLHGAGCGCQASGLGLPRHRRPRTVRRVPGTQDMFAA